MDKETTEIAKLTGRISKDPKSKLFVPLAEEYKKAGDMEMAIHVLLEGLKNNPEYVTARSSLGKLLLAKGDLAGAQKEFEEVVKTTPDNFMAQKKLGDVLILQNSPLDALSHYKIAFSLNPSDGELASLISDVEAGRDVRTTIQPLKTKTNADQAIKQEPPALGSAPSAPGLVPPHPLNAEPKTPAGTPHVLQAESPAPFTEVVPAPAATITETEEAEEVLVVEPLEPEVSSQEPPAAGIDLQEAHELPAVPSVVPEESFDLDFQADNQLPDELVVSQDIRPETELFNVEDRGTIPTGASEEIAADEIVEIKPGEEVLENIPESAFEDISGKSDDFTTDTLAELYISQGFFEKAVEIYERMLVDKPNSRGLQDKLSWVRDAVARAVAPASEQKKEAEIFVAQEAREYVPAAGSGEVAVESMEENRPQEKEDAAVFKPDGVIGAGEYVPSVDPEDVLLEAEVVAEPDELGPGKKSAEENRAAESREYEPASLTKEQTTVGAGFNISAATSAHAQAGPKSDFEPREYVLPAMEQESSESASGAEHETRVPRVPGRKETIARLETWLTTIKKEK
jgi:tetratricopeptide (TPR) repeat protein